MARKKQHYVDNTTFYEAMVAYKRDVDAGYNPPVPDYAAQAFLDIARRLATRPNFNNYRFKDEMIMDGVENCLKYIKNFDPEASTKNPFSYFTQIIYYAFLRRIEKEKKQLYIRGKLVEKADIYNLSSDTQENDTADYSGGVKSNEWSQEYMDSFMENFEENKRRKQAHKHNKRLDTIIEENQDVDGNDSAVWDDSTGLWEER